MAAQGCWNVSGIQAQHGGSALGMDSYTGKYWIANISEWIYQLANLHLLISGTYS